MRTSARAPPSRRLAGRRPAAPDPAARCRRASRQDAGALWLVIGALVGAFTASAQNRQDPSLKGAVNVRRDGRGIPYIKAANEHDLFFAQGYVTASDRLFQMEMLRRAVRGELAEVLGKDVLDEDKRRRVYGFGRLADASVPLQAPDFGSALAAYADGVNAWVDGHRETLPVEFAKLRIEWRPWRPADTLLIGYLFAEDLSTTWPNDLAAFAFADLPKETFAYFFPSTTPNDVYLVGGVKSKQKERPPGGIVISQSPEAPPRLRSAAFHPPHPAASCRPHSASRLPYLGD